MPESATFGFRPEDIRFDGKGIEFTGRNMVIEALGPQSVVLVMTPEGDAKLVTTSLEKKQSEPITFYVPEERVHLFRHPGGEAWESVT